MSGSLLFSHAEVVTLYTNTRTLSYTRLHNCSENSWVQAAVAAAVVTAQVKHSWQFVCKQNANAPKGKRESESEGGTERERREKSKASKRNVPTLRRGNYRTAQTSELSDYPTAGSHIFSRDCVAFVCCCYCCLLFWP